jgi:uncharacterized protein with beta-barrel porin domain
VLNTQGANATAVLAQSIGGGGGWGGSAASSGSGNSTANLNLALGGTGGGGGAGGGVTVAVGTSDSTISTAGLNAFGVLAQSIGGGGGTGAVAVASSSSGLLTASLSASLGGTGGSGGAGGSVSLSSIGAVSTSGVQSAGLVAQSVGGGGGVVGLTDMPGTATVNGTVTAHLGQSGGGGANGAVSVSGTTNISTSGLQSMGLLAQGITGGGGLATASSASTSVFTGTVKLGATGGASASTVAATVNLSGGSITTAGAMSPGIVAQSIGGGGGLALLRASNVVLGGLVKGNAYQSGAYSTTVTSAASISTSGAASIGIVAQAIGGGGGLAFASGKATLGGAPGGSDAGAVVVNSNASITTSGVNAFGILAQSVGGGGGAVLSTGDAVSATFNPGAGNSGGVTVNVNANITTSGAGAHGVVAQSVCGGGGLVINGTTTTMQGGNQCASGLVNVVVAPGVSISATGKDAVGIKTWSSTDPVVTIGAGASVIGAAGASALVFEGPTNELHNSGTVHSADGGMAVHVLSGDMMVRNSGTLSGTVRMADGANNLLHNQAGGILLAGDTIHLGGSGVLHNEGVIKQTGGVTRIEGSLTQSASGTLEVLVDHAKGTVGGISVSGSAKLSGTLQPKHSNGAQMAPGTLMGTLVSADKGVDASALLVANTAVMRYTLSSKGGELGLSSTADFAPDELPDEFEALGTAIGEAQALGKVHFQELTATLVGLPTVAHLRQAYWNVGGAAAGASSTVAGLLQNAFTRLLGQRAGQASRGVPTDGDTRLDRSDRVTTGGLDALGESVWVQAFDESHQRGAEPDAPGADLSAGIQGVALGADRRLSASTSAGLALAIGSSRFDLSNGFSGRSDAFQLGAYGQREWDVAYANAAVSYAWHQLRTNRALSLLQTLYTADFAAHSLAARGEAGLRLGTPALAITPYAALQWQHVLTPAYAESATLNDQAHLGLDYGLRRLSTTRVELGAALENQSTLANGQPLRLRASLAAAHVYEGRHGVDASFVTLPEARFGLLGQSTVSQVALVGVSAELSLNRRLAVSFNFNGEFGQRSQTRVGSASLRYQW